MAMVCVLTLPQPLAAFDPPSHPWEVPSREAAPDEPPPPPPRPPAADSGQSTSAEAGRRWVMPKPNTSNPVPFSDVDLQGSFVLELTGGVIGGLIGLAFFLAGAVQVLDDSRGCSSCGVLLAVGVGLLFFGPPIGVTIAGNATGGEGSFGWSLVGTFAGIFLSAPGMIAGAIIGYRASAPDQPTIPPIAILPTPDLHGVQLHMGARF
jgi:hypothetical protein